MTDRLSTGPRPWTANGYADACKRAATAQGLDPLTAAAQARAGELERVGITYSVEQTGGFTMVATFYVSGEAITCTYEGAWIVCAQPVEQWTDGTGESFEDLSSRDLQDPAVIVNVVLDRALVG
jgi:hypothetical protein